MSQTRLQTLMFLVLFIITGNHAMAVSEGQSACETPYEEHGVYDATIVYMVDEIANGAFFLAMDADRNTEAYRQYAYDFFSARFGIDFDVSNGDMQVVGDGEGGVAHVVALKPDISSTHQVYGIDAQRIPQWRSKMPLTQVAFFDDGFFVTMETDLRVHGTFGGKDGIVLPAGTQLVAGEYRLFDDKANLLETFRYKSNIPVAALPVGGSFEATEGAVFLTIACEVESALFGHGNVRALGEIRPLPGGRTALDFRYVMRFPGSLAEGGSQRPHCDALPALMR